MDVDIGELLATGHIVIITLGLLLSTVALLQGIQDTTDEGILSDRTPTQEVRTDEPVQERNRIHEAAESGVAPSTGQDREPAVRGEGEA